MIAWLDGAADGPAALLNGDLVAWDARCYGCGGRLGHVFSRAGGGRRHCVNGCALCSVPAATGMEFESESDLCESESESESGSCEGNTSVMALMGVNDRL